MGRARGGNALLESKGGHEVGDGAFQRLSLDAAHSKVEVAASVAGTRLPNLTKKCVLFVVLRLFEVRLQASKSNVFFGKSYPERSTARRNDFN